MLMENAEFEKLLAQYDYSHKKGDLVNGIVCGYSSYGAIVDIGTKATALCPTREASVDDTNIEEALPKGQTFEFIVIREEDEDGQYLISYKKVAQAYVWKQLQEVKEKDEAVEGKVLSVVRGGIIVDIAGIRGFVPSSHVKAKASDTKIGEVLELKIITIDPIQNNLILSNRNTYTNATVDKTSLIEAMTIGDIVEGEVVRITDFGAFVDIGGLDGLLPLSQISWKWVEHPSDVLTLGEKINVEVIAIDKDKQRISLSLKNTMPDPWAAAENKLTEGELIKGKIVRLKPFGAFVEILNGIEALLPTSDVAEYEKINGKQLALDDEIDAVIVKFNLDDRRVSLSLKKD